jgi:hypothetical protein
MRHCSPDRGGDLSSNPPHFGARGGLLTEQTADNLAAASVQANDDELQRLGEASASTPEDCPCGKPGIAQRHRVIDVTG